MEIKNDLKYLGTSLLEVPRMKSNRGISLISLAITIIVLIIIAAIAFVGGFTKNADEAAFAKMYNEIVEVEAAVVQRSYEHKLDSVVYPYESKKSYSETNTITINNITYGEGYHLVTEKELANLGITGITREYIVNYWNGDVVLKEPYYLADRAVHTKEEMLNVYSETAVISQAEYDEAKGINKPLLKAGMLPVKYDGSNWIVTHKDDPEWYDYSAGSEGGPNRYANVMLLDDTTLKDASGRIYSNETIRGMNLDNLVGMKVEKEGSMFIWIPRYTYKEESDGSISIVYSQLTRDYIANGYTKSPAFYYGAYTGAETSIDVNTGYVAGGKELTGIWISKYEAGYLN